MSLQAFELPMQQESRAILHLDLDAFFVSVEQLQNNNLQGKPVIIGGKSDRGVVASCSYEARSYGVSSAMPMKEALRKCPHATVVGSDMALYSYYSQLVTEIVSQRVPLFQKSSIDEFYADLTGMDRFYGCYETAKQLRQEIRDKAGLPNTFGLAANKTVAKMATDEAKPNGMKYVPNGEEHTFLAPLPISKIPMVGDKTCNVLQTNGIYKIGDLSRMTPEQLEQLLGKQGLALWERANGIDPSPVVSHHEAKSISSERTFRQDSNDPYALQDLLVGLTEKVAHELRESEKQCACITVKLRYSNFDTVSKQTHIPHTASDHELIPHVKELFNRLYDRKRQIRLIGVRLTDFIQGSDQLKLFDNTQSKTSLYKAIDTIKRKHGPDKMTKGSTR